MARSPMHLPAPFDQMAAAAPTDTHDRQREQNSFDLTRNLIVSGMDLRTAAKLARSQGDEDTARVFEAQAKWETKWASGAEGRVEQRQRSPLIAIFDVQAHRSALRAPLAILVPQTTDAFGHRLTPDGLYVNASTTSATARSTGRCRSTRW